MPPTERDRQAIYDHYGLTCPPRYATLRNFDNPTYGGKVTKIAAALGTPLMPWQRYAADTGLEVDRRTGLFVYRKLGVRVPRQSGKTSLILPVAAHRAMAWQRQRILYAAQNGTAAREKWEDDQIPAIEASPLASRVHIRKANGREAFIWKKTRSIHSLQANTEKAGHGKTLHLGKADEYFAQVDYRIEAAWTPAMITVPMAQMWWYSTAGTSKSVPLNDETDRGRAIVESGEPSSTAYFEWSGEKGADYTDPRVWLSCMPALCPAPVDGVCRCSPAWRHTVTPATMRAELEAAQEKPAKLAEWLRAFMNWTRDDDDIEADPNLPSVEAWDLLADSRPSAGPGDVVAFAIDITPLRDHASISVAGVRPDGIRRTELVAHGEGTDWIIGRARELHERHNPVAWGIDERSPAATLKTPLRDIGIKPMGTAPHRGGLWLLSTTDYGAACGSWADAVKQGTLSQPGEPRTRAALIGARTRPLGDGAWGLGRKPSVGADISPLVTDVIALATFERYKDLAAPYDALDNIW